MDDPPDCAALEMERRDVELCLAGAASAAVVADTAVVAEVAALVAGGTTAADYPKLAIGAAENAAGT